MGYKYLKARNDLGKRSATLFYSLLRHWKMLIIIMKVCSASKFESPLFERAIMGSFRRLRENKRYVWLNARLITDNPCGF